MENRRKPIYETGNPSNFMHAEKDFEVIIIGGSYAGLSAAMALGRSLRQVLVLDSGQPCNRQTPHAHNFITQDGESPDAIREKAKKQVLHYRSVQFRDDLALSAQKEGNQFRITTQSGQFLRTKQLILATGIKDAMPDIEGFSACWGISVIHCPYCHGYEFRHLKTGILANGERGFHLGSLVHNLTRNLTILTQGKADFTDSQIQRFNRHEISIKETSIAALEHINGQIKNLVYQDGTKEEFDVLYAALPFTQHSDIALQLGCELTEHGHIKTDSFQATTVSGVFACGDNAAMMRSVAHAVHSGNLAGAMANKSLIDTDF